MKILAIECELPRATEEHFQQQAKAEARKVWELTQAGIVREIYFRADKNEAVLILECSSVQEAETMLSGLPFVQHNLIRFELIPLRAYPGLERLFAES
jgi:muconolactone delta-isomerase